MPAARPPEFRRRAVELTRLREKPIAQIAKDLGVAESALRRWMAQADADEGKSDALSTDERKELVELRRAKRTLEMEVEILKRASAYFARENVLPNEVLGGGHDHRRGPHDRGGSRLPGARGVAVELLRVGRAQPASVIS